jgi:hypothetical protein
MTSILNPGNGCAAYRRCPIGGMGLWDGEPSIVACPRWNVDQHGVRRGCLGTSSLASMASGVSWAWPRSAASDAEWWMCVRRILGQLLPRTTPSDSVRRAWLNTFRLRGTGVVVMYRWRRVRDDSNMVIHISYWCTRSDGDRSRSK